MDSEPQMFDKFKLPNPISDLTSKEFMKEPRKRLTISSPNLHKTIYILEIEWSEIGLNFREARLLE